MASWGALNVQERKSIERWQDRARQLNERAAAAVRAAQEVLSEFKTTAIGQVFDKVVEYSGTVISGMRQILEGMNKILETVTKLINGVMNKIRELVSGTTDKQRQTVG